jgi:hypothetical protein
LKVLARSWRPSDQPPDAVLAAAPGHAARDFRLLRQVRGVVHWIAASPTDEVIWWIFCDPSLNCTVSALTAATLAEGGASAAEEREPRGWWYWVLCADGFLTVRSGSVASRVEANLALLEVSERISKLHVEGPSGRRVLALRD